MKFTAVLAACFAGFFYLSSAGEVQRIRTIQAIEKAPAFASAVVEAVEKFPGKRQSSTYRVLFRYEVGGRRYLTMSNSTDENGLKRLTGEPVEVVYDATNPGTATLKRYYDFSDRTETMAWTLLGRAIMSLLLALPISLLLAWQMGWLGRGAKVQAGAPR